jgi:hypothetical protein
VAGWTTADLEAVEDAIRACTTAMSGKQIGEYRTNLQSVRYRDLDLPALLKLRDQMRAEVESASAGGDLTSLADVDAF